MEELDIFLQDSAQQIEMPVSYTHLDVYKRQALHTCSRASGDFRIIIPYF